MNSGAFGENFPYSNFHDLNMDWIIKIAKDFLDQYSHIQQTIAEGETALGNLTTEGLQQLQEKADALEELLQTWYNEHSEDIANQLADALSDLNNWYTEHEGYLDSYVADSIEDFDNHADLKTAQSIASIPDDYTTLSNNVVDLEKAITKKSISETVTLNVNAYINKNTGEYIAMNTYKAVTRMAIPKGVRMIRFPDTLFITSGIAGWATYADIDSPATSVFIRGGQTEYIIVGENDKAFGVCTAELTFPTIQIEYIYDLRNIVEEFANSIITDNAIATANVYVDYSTGGILPLQTNNYSATMRLPVPFGCKKIYFPDNKYNFSGTAGWATYKYGVGRAVEAFNRGGQNNYIDITEDDRYFAVSSYKDQNPPATIKIVYAFGNGAEIYETKNPLYNKMLCFCGDSVTYGFDDDNAGAQLANPWTKQVAEQLNTTVINEGVNSASLMYGTMGDDEVPTARAWVRWYPNLDNRYDIIGVMIGINDCFRDYTLGSFNDTTEDTFYGALHIFWKGMIAKYQPDNNKRLFCMLYPAYEGKPNTWGSFVNAMIEVANYYSIPILDLSKTMGISYHADQNYQYWRNQNGIHSAHLTQKGANTISHTISAFIQRMFTK